MPFGFSDTFTVEQQSSWSNAWATPAEDWQQDEDLKRQFAAQLPLHDDAFNAALAVIGDTGKALWAAKYWANDPIVLAAKAVQRSEEFLDKAALSARLLKFAEEKDPSQRFYVVEAKDRLAAYKLYAEIQGFIGNKIDINASTNTINNLMQIKFVRPEKVEQVKTIETAIEQQEEKLPLNLKLVSAR